jgi:hypothetical protein
VNDVSDELGESAPKRPHPVFPTGMTRSWSSKDSARQKPVDSQKKDIQSSASSHEPERTGLSDGDADGEMPPADLSGKERNPNRANDVRTNIMPIYLTTDS